MEPGSKAKSLLLVATFTIVFTFWVMVETAIIMLGLYFGDITPQSTHLMFLMSLIANALINVGTIVSCLSVAFEQGSRYQWLAVAVAVNALLQYLAYFIMVIQWFNYKPQVEKEEEQGLDKMEVRSQSSLQLMPVPSNFF